MIFQLSVGRRRVKRSMFKDEKRSWMRKTRKAMPKGELHGQKTGGGGGSRVFMTTLCKELIGV